MKHIVLLSFWAASGLLAGEALTIESVAANRSLWPREVTVHVAHSVPIVVNGKPSGSMQAPAGRVYPVKAVGSSGVQVDAMGAPLNFPATDTDLLARAEALREKQQAAAAATPAPTPAPVAQATPAPAATPAPSNRIAEALNSKLVVADGKKLEPFDASQLGTKKYLAIYFSASWCPPCRNFTPDLVSFYKRKKAARDLFDVVLVSNDKTEEDMIAYMKEYKMDWPALDFGTAKSHNPLRKYSGSGIPCLVIIDGNGTVVSDSYVNGEYRGPRAVLKDLEKLLKDS